MMNKNNEKRNIFVTLLRRGTFAFLFFAYFLIANAAGSENRDFIQSEWTVLGLILGMNLILFSRDIIEFVKKKF
jgi:hypothetical protein